MIVAVCLAMLLAAVCNSPAQATGHYSNAASSHRLIMQIIDGQFHKWLEYNEPGSGALTVYLLEPEKKLLDPHEAEVLLEASRQWLEPYHFTSLQTPPVQQALQGTITDNRTAVAGNLTLTHPYNTIGILVVDFAHDYTRSTGFLISPYTALTNAHNLYSTALGGWFKRVRFSPGQYETTWPESFRPFSTLEPVRTEVNQTFLRFESYNDRENLIRYDYAALFFDRPFEGITTFMPLQFNHIPTLVSVVGYPGFIRGAPSQGQWLTEGTVLSHDTHCLFYSALTSGGSSGSPVFEYNREAGSYRVVAIHSFAFENQLISGGPHLNNLNREQIESWLRWKPAGQTDPAVRLTLDKYQLTLNTGAFEALVASIHPPEAAGMPLTWSSSNIAVATVDANGLVTARGSGSAVITVQTADGSAVARCAVTVSTSPGTAVPVDSATMRGDLNGDRLINIQDVIIAYQHVLQIRILPANLSANADANRDGLVDVRDVSLMMQHTLGLAGIAQ